MTKNDYIDRKVAIDALNALCDRECEYSKQQRSFMCSACRLGSAFDVIDELASVQSQMMRGRWTDNNACPFCGFQPWYEQNINTLSFCPNCGADMRGSE